MPNFTCTIDFLLVPFSTFDIISLFFFQLYDVLNEYYGYQNEDIEINDALDPVPKEYIEEMNGVPNLTPKDDEPKEVPVKNSTDVTREFFIHNSSNKLKTKKK